MFSRVSSKQIESRGLLEVNISHLPVRSTTLYLITLFKTEGVQSIVNKSKSKSKLSNSHQHKKKKKKKEKESSRRKSSKSKKSKSKKSKKKHQRSESESDSESSNSEKSDAQERIEKQLKLEKLRAERLIREKKERERANNGGEILQFLSSPSACLRSGASRNPDWWSFLLASKLFLEFLSFFVTLVPMKFSFFLF